MSDEEEIIDLDTIGAELKEQHDILFEQNAAMVVANRRKALKMIQMAEVYEEMAGNCRQIAAANILMASQLSEGVADLLSGEFNIDIIPADEDEEFEEDDE